MAEKKAKKYSGIGGQAVMEGIMMKNESRYSVAVRKTDGNIETTVRDCPEANRGSFAKLPFVRGVFTFVDSLVLGMQSLSYSASFFEDEEEEKPKTEAESKFFMGIAVALSLLFSVVLFMLVPFFVTELVRKLTDSNIVLAIVEGVLRLLIFIGYVAAISLMDDIKRVYMYHGAEHKCINCIEHGKELTVENVMKSSRFHERCGTSFMLFVMVISIILFFFIRTDNMLLRLASRLILIPVIAGISYEVIRIAGKSDNPIVKLISAPGLCLQKITTKEPDEKMAEVAIKAVEAVFDWRKYLSENFGVEAKETVPELDIDKYLYSEETDPCVEEGSADEIS